MTRTSIRLYTLTAPLALLPLLDVRLSELPEWLKGPEFLGLVSQLVTQVLSGLADGIITLLVNALFGVSSA